MNRAIFEYVDATETRRFADPMRVLRLLSLHLDGEPDEVVKQSRSDNPQVAFPAMETLLNAISKAFDLPRFDPATGHGNPEELLLDTYEDFLLWITKKKVTPRSQPTSPASSAEASLPATPNPIPLAVPPSFPTNSSSASG